MRYRSRPSEIEAMQWTGDNVYECIEFTDNRAGTDDDGVMRLLAGQDGAQEWVPVPVGHWIVRRAGDLTDHWPVSVEHFANKYERVDDE